MKMKHMNVLYLIYSEYGEYGVDGFEFHNVSTDLDIAIVSFITISCNGDFKMKYNGQYGSLHLVQAVADEETADAISRECYKDRNERRDPIRVKRNEKASLLVDFREINWRIIDMDDVVDFAKSLGYDTEKDEVMEYIASKEFLSEYTLEWSNYVNENIIKNH